MQVFSPLVLLVFLALPAVEISACESPYSQVVIFGDSLSDPGNLYEMVGLPTSPPYYEGRFSNGPVWAEHFAVGLGLEDANILNLAVGSSDTSEVFEQQVLPFVSANALDSDALIVLFAGGNDFLEMASTPEEVITDAVTNLATSIYYLYLAGGKQFMVATLPDLGLTPFVLSTGDPAQIGGATYLSDIFNQTLIATLQDTAANLGVEITILDTFYFMNTLVDKHDKFDIDNTTESALLPDYSTVDNPDSYFFWDSVHPTGHVHQILSDYALLVAVIADLQSEVATALVAGDLSEKHAIKLQDKLAEASDQTQALKFKKTANTLKSFRNKVNSLINSDKLDESIGDSWIDAAKLFGSCKDDRKCGDDSDDDEGDCDHHDHDD